MTKENIIQYVSMQEEIKETRVKIEKLNSDIRKIEADLANIIEEGTVKDKVKGGMGGIQSFNIEGFPCDEYDKKRSKLLEKKILLNNRKSTLDILEFDLLRMTNEVEEYIVSIQDSHIRRIINFRIIDGLSWNQVADRMGGLNTDESVRKAFCRFIENS